MPSNGDGLKSGQRHALDQERGRIYAMAELQIIGRGHVQEHIFQIARNGHLTDRKTNLAVFNPKSRGAATIIARHPIDPHADKLGDIKPSADVFQQGRNALAAGLHI